MQEEKVAVTFQPSGKTVHVLRGTSMLETAAAVGITLDLPCGGEGTCGKCRVVVQCGACEPTDAERNAFTPEEIDDGWRLACQSAICGPTEVEVPETSILGAGHKILAHREDAGEATGEATIDPTVRKKYVELPEPRRGDDASDMIRLERVLGPLEADLELLRKIPGRLRRNRFRGTAVVAEGCLIDFEPGNTQSESFAVALDIGTTTLVAVLLDLNTGAELAVASRINPQTGFGDDVLARICHARETPDGLHELHETIVEAVDEMIGELTSDAKIDRERIYTLTVSGNTTMQQLFCRIDTSSLGELPFVPAVGRHLLLPAARLGQRIHPRGRVYVMPVIGGFVGGDTVSGILATGLADADGPTLFVDIGTNGEIVLAADGKLSAASTAAGPAFEGARISQGMRGCTGAIEKVIVDGRLRTNVIGNVPPVGLCGSALIDLAAELLRHGVLSPEGRLRSGDELPDRAPADLRRRVLVQNQNGQAAFLLAEETETANERPIMVTQRDFRELQLATGAIRAGIVILLRRAGVEPADLDQVLIAGGFGNFIRRSNAQRIGLLPPRIEHHRIRYQGNTSLAGARLTAVSRHARALAQNLARRTEHVDLSRDAGFQTVFAEAMIFPSDDG